MQRIAVIGGGIAGLTVALRREQLGDRVSLFEASARLGGQLQSEAQDGFVIEHGAEGFVARSEVIPALSSEAGVGDHIVEQLAQRSFRFDGQSLIELAPGEAGRLLGFQVSPDDLGRGIRSFLHGMDELPVRLASLLAPKVELHLQQPIARVAPRAAGVTLVDAQGQALDFDAAVVATTARSAANLLGDALGGPARALQESSLLSSLTVALAYRRDAVAHPLDGTGFIVPEPEQLEGVRAVTFSTSKFPNRAPADHVLLRLFFRPSTEDSTLSDDAWRERAERALASALSVRGAAQRAFVSRWPHALPVFDPAHRARIAALEAALRREAPKVWLAGAAFHGSGVDAAIRSAEMTARAIPAGT
ncbi:MAG TPA: FAD-dependent oxidoreductase [Polyangiaceae bacterium]|nr:FAD-dependent oxidoreductase [Polyangiaceae bacterium]